jgi:methanogenic corrinoid protein MtbC1
MVRDTPALDSAGLKQFQDLRADAIDAVTERFYENHGDTYSQFGPRGREACREDLAFHLEFLRPVLEFGLVQPMVDYLRWLSSVLITRDVPAQHLALSLEWLAEFFAISMRGQAGAIVVKALHKVREQFLEPHFAPPAIYEMMPARWQESEEFQTALLGGDRRGAGALLDRCLDQGHGLVDIELHVIQPAMYEIGLKWQNNQVTVAQEHLATAISQSVMTQGLLQSRVPASNGKRVLLACVEGNNHAMGLQMVADAFQLAGWEVQFLGASVPTNALLHYLGQFKPDLLGLSISFAQQLPVAKDIIQRLARSPPAGRPAVIVGGLAINQFNLLADTLGADASSPDSRSAVASASVLSVRRELR